MEYLNHTQNFNVSVDEVDYKERLKPSAIMQYFQDLATVHAVMLNIGYEVLKEQNLFWVLSRLSIRVNKYPSLNQDIKVVTYPRAPHLADAIRDFYIFDMDGNVLINGTTKWCVISGTTRLPKRCAPLFKFEIDEYNPNDSVSDGNIKIPNLENPKFIYSNTVRITELDRNIHMNNAIYGDIIYNACDIEKLNEYSMKSFDINFLAESKLGDNYNVNVDDTNKDSWLFEGIRLSDNKPLFRAKIDWSKNENF